MGTKQSHVDPNSYLGAFILKGKVSNTDTVADAFLFCDTKHLRLLEMGVSLSALAGGSSPTVAPTLYTVDAGYELLETTNRTALKVGSTADAVNEKVCTRYTDQDFTSYQALTNAQDILSGFKGTYGFRTQLSVTVTGSPTSWSGFVWAVLRPYTWIDG